MNINASTFNYQFSTIKMGWRFGGPATERDGLKKQFATFSAGGWCKRLNFQFSTFNSQLSILLGRKEHKGAKTAKKRRTKLEEYRNAKNAEEQSSQRDQGAQGRG